MNSPLKQVPRKLLSIGNKVLSQLFAVSRQYSFANVVNKQVDFGVWLKRRGHAPELKLRYISIVPQASHTRKFA